MLKIVGHRSHTIGPMVAARRFSLWLDEQNMLAATQHIEIDLYGSLALTGKGHAADWRASAMLRFCRLGGAAKERSAWLVPWRRGGLTAAFGSSNAQIENAAEIGREHDWG